MKKLLSILSTLSIINGGFSSVLSCKDISYAGIEGQKTMVLSDSGPRDDKSFNQSAYEGMLKWSSDVVENNEDYTTNFIQPKSTDSADILQTLKPIRRYKPNALILAGGTFGDDIEEIAESVDSDSKILWVDGTADQTGDYNNIICIQFQSEIAGFEAGYGAVDSFLNINNNKNKDIQLGTYGGGTGNLPYGVTYYMWGFILGAIFYGVNNSYEHSITVNCGTNGSGDNNNVNWNGNSVTTTGTLSSFTGNFTQGSNESINYANMFKKNDINFVVAGPQVADLLSKLDSNQYVVGVDVDQSQQYSDYASHFLFSAGKDIKSAVYTTLSNLSSLKQKNNSYGDESLLPWQGMKSSKTVIDNSWSKLLTSNLNVVNDEEIIKKYNDIGNQYSKFIDSGYDEAVSKTSNSSGIDIPLNTICDTLDKINKININEVCYE